METEERKRMSKQYEDLTLEDLETLTTLGMGGFGRVELVSDQVSDSSLSCHHYYVM